MTSQDWTSQDWTDLASVYRAGAKSHEKNVNRPSGSWAQVEAHEAMARQCEELAKQRARQEQAAGTDAGHVRLMVDALCRAVGGPAREELEKLEAREVKPAARKTRRP